MAATDSESIHDNMTRLRMRMVQQKLANERDKLQHRPSSVSSSDDNVDQLKIQQAMLRRQELIDRIRQEQLSDLNRPRSHVERRRYTPDPLPPPPSRLSLPDLHRHCHYRHTSNNRAPIGTDMSQVKHVIEHKYRQPELPAVHTYQLPPIATPPAIIQPAMQPGYAAMASPSPIITTVPQFQTLDLVAPRKEEKSTFFNKGEFMDMMMMQNAQMHHMAMQQMMVRNLQGSAPAQLATPVAAAPVMPAAPVYPRPVYHHHYGGMAAPAAPMMYHHQSMPNYDMSGGFYPFHHLPGLRGRSRFRRKYDGEFPPNSKKTPDAAIQGIRRLRHIAYCAWFIACLKASVKKNKGSRPSSVFLFGIILKEIVAALHRLYLNPTGNIYPVMGDIIGPNAKDLSSLVGGRNITRDQAQLLQVLAYVVENLIYHITEIMPRSGVLGTHRKAAVFELIKNGQRFPDGYFWQVELDRLQFNGSGRTTNIGQQEAYLLLLGIFVSRSLITTLLLKPIDYGLSTEPLSDIHQRNLKVLSTVLLYVVRKASGPKGQPTMPIPGEVVKYVFRDDEMRGIHLSLRKTYEYCENLLREWGAEYIKRLREAAASDPRGEKLTTKK
ncbi:uncharacterized protein LOC124272404 [Haliotis rubra]|uniref:uncharacterized protein LOC124272404 n=1 Tax=Haliotis rubra TaxID=36100 RepID=UPI001EE559AC|nr:uncharacterized protein LOC124272404 [Haliotis rubra]